MKKFCSISHLHFFPSNPTTLNVFPKTFLTEMKPSNTQQKKKREEETKLNFT